MKKIIAGILYHPTIRPAWLKLSTFVLRNLFWRPFKSNALFRKALFISAPPGNLLMASASKEHFIVSSNDQFIGRETYIKGPYDFEKLENVLSLLGDSFNAKTLIDVGANIGTICIPAVSRGLFRKAIAIEPEPFNYSLLCSNIYLNGLQESISTQNVALGAESGQSLEFELSNVNFGDHRIRVTNSEGVDREHDRRIIEIRCERLDEIVREVDSTNTLIWMDTQGFEGYVLQGAKNALAKRTPLVIEFWPYGMNRSGSYLALRDSIIDAGYAYFYDLNKGGAKTKVSVKALDDKFESLGLDGAATDLLLI
jgi:FkbM family methyltransferase